MHNDRNGRQKKTETSYRRYICRWKKVFAASEECAIRAVEPSAKTWTPEAGSPVIVQTGKGLVRKGIEHPFQEVKI